MLYSIQEALAVSWQIFAVFTLSALAERGGAACDGLQDIYIFSLYVMDEAYSGFRVGVPPTGALCAIRRVNEMQRSSRENACCQQCGQMSGHDSPRRGE